MKKSAVEDKAWKKDHPAEVHRSQGARHDGRVVHPPLDVVINPGFPRPGSQIIPLPLQATVNIGGTTTDVVDISASVVVGDGTGPGVVLVYPGQPMIPAAICSTWIPDFNQNQIDLGLPAVLIVRANLRDGSTMTLNVPFIATP